MKITGKLLSRLPALALAAAVLLALSVCGGGARAAEWTGGGTQEDPWVIRDAYDLLALAENVNSGNSYAGCWFSLAGDIDLSGVCGQYLGSWVPIGRGADITFKGTFDGGGNTVKNLYIDSSEEYRGLFGHSTGVIKDLAVSGSVTGGNFTGGLAARSDGTVTNCSFSGTVNGSSYVGGLLGATGPGCTVSGCSSSATVTGNGSSIGGLIGWANDVFTYTGRQDLLTDQSGLAGGRGNVTNCAFTGKVTGTGRPVTSSYDEEAGILTLYVKDNAVGGVVGWSNGYQVTSCRSEGTVNGFEFTGGVVGDSSNGGSVISCVNTGKVTGTSYLTGGVAGRISKGRLAGCSNSGEVTGKYFTGGVAGFTDIESFVDKIAGVTVSSNSGTVKGSQQTGGLIGVSNCKIDAALFNTGTVTGSYSTGGVVGYTSMPISSCYNGAGGTVSGAEQTGGAVGRAKGAVSSCRNDGTVTGTGSYTGGAVGRADSSVSFCGNSSGGSVTGADYTGGAAGSAYGSVSGCVNNGSVTGSGEKSGGVVGYAAAAVSGCENQGEVTGANITAGVVSTASGKVSACSNTGSVTGRGSCTAGVVGLTVADVTGCYNAGTVLTNSIITGYTGGVAGRSFKEEGSNYIPSVSDCQNRGSVSGPMYVGGVVGCADSKVSGCENESGASVSGSTMIGGVAGYNSGEIMSCVNSGTVSGYEYTGGVAGNTSPSCSITDCRNAGEVTCSTKRCGGVAGNLEGSASGCENTGTVSGGTECAGGIAGFVSSDGAITNSRNSGAVECPDMAGGIAGYSYGQLVGCTNKTAVGNENGGSSNLGGIVGINSSSGTVRSCANISPLEGSENVGGVCGASAGAAVDCENSAAVSGAKNVGGIVGIAGKLESSSDTDSPPSVASCLNSGPVTASGGYVGGVAGELSTGTVNSCVNAGTVTGQANGAGGIAGHIGSGSNIESSRNSGAISGPGYTGGVVGESWGIVSSCGNEKNGSVTCTGQFTGGVAGYVGGGQISASYNAGTVSGQNYTGGIAGQTKSPIQASRNIGIVSGVEGVGGVAGVSNSSVKGCFNAGTVTGSVNVGGVVGFAQGAVTECYNDKNGKVKCTGSYDGYCCAGGVVGYQENGSISYCYNSGSVSGTTDAKGTGGVVGRTDVAVKYCYNDRGGTVSGLQYVGGVVGYSNTFKSQYIEYCLNMGTVGSGTDKGTFVGGVVGLGVSVIKCSNGGTVKGKLFVGGVIGYSVGGNVELCTNSLSGEVFGPESDANTYAYVGGIIGTAESKATIKRCWNDGAVSADSRYVGGVIGELSDGCTLENSYNTGAVSALNFVGGVVGYMTGDNTTMQYCFNYNEVPSFVVHDNWGKLAGDCKNGAVIKNCYYTNGSAAPVTKLSSSAEGKYEYLTNEKMASLDPCYFKGWHVNDKSYNIWYQEKGYSFPRLVGDDDFYYPLAGTVQTEDLYISTAAELRAFRDEVNNGKSFKDSTVYLTDDIDLGGEAWTPIGTGDYISGGMFYGTFDGQGHTVSGLNVSYGDGPAGFFGKILGATVRNLLVEGSVTGTKPVTGVQGVGGLVGVSYSGVIYGLSNSTIERCGFIGAVSGNGHSGGLVGQNEGSVVDCFHVGSVYGNRAAGGVIGANMALDSEANYKDGSNITEPVRNCFHYGGKITSDDVENVGGVVGVTKGYLNRNTGDLYFGFSDCCYESGSASCGACTVNYDSSGSNFMDLERGSTVSYLSSYLAIIPPSPLSQEQFRSASSFPGWDFDAVWGMGADMPRLRVLSVPVSISKNDDGSRASGTMPETLWLIKSGERVNSAFTANSGYCFGGWNTAADGSGQGYADGAFIVPDADSALTLCAQWLRGTNYGGKYTASGQGRELTDGSESTEWTVTGLTAGQSFSMEFSTADAIRPSAFSLTTGASAGTDPDCNPDSWVLSGKVHKGDAWTVLARSGSKTAALPDLGLKTCWYPVTDAGSEYYSFFRITFTTRNGGTFRLAELMLLTADPAADVLRPLSLDPNGGSGTRTTLDLSNGSREALPQCPFSFDDRIFAGWNTEPDGSGAFFSDGQKITADGYTVLYAQWIDGKEYHRYVPVSASHEGYANQTFEKLFDNDQTNDKNSKWCFGGLSGDDVWYAEFATKDYIRPSAYCLTTGSDTENYPGRSPNKWKLEALNAFGDWVTVSSVTDGALPAANNAQRYFGVDGNGEYCRFRITFQGIVSGTGTFQLAEVCLLTASDGDIRLPQVSFDPNGGSGSALYKTAENLSEISLPENAYTFEGFSFAGWNTERDGSGTTYSPGNSYTVQGDSTLYAMWTPLTFTVTFKSEDGSEVLYTQQVRGGELPVYSGPTLSKDPGDGNTYSFDGWEPAISPVTSDQVYTAKFMVMEPMSSSDAVFSASGADSGTLSNVKSGMKYSLDGGKTWKDITSDSVVISSGVGSANGVWVYTPGNGETTADSAIQKIKITKPKKPSLEVTQPSVIGGSGSINSTKAHEYSSDGGKTWKDCAENQELAPGTYQVRVKASGTVLRSAAQTVTVEEFSASQEGAPKAVFTASGPDRGRLTGVSAGMKYRTDGGEWKDITGSSVTLTGLKACTIEVYMPGNGSTTTDSAVKAIEVTKAAKPSLKVTQPTEPGGAGSVAAADTHEYSKDGKTWTACQGAVALEPGTYYVRVRAAGTVLASESQTVKITSPTGIQASVSGSTVTYSVWSAPEGAKLVAARYDSGRMTCVRVIDSPPASGSVTLDGAGTAFRLYLADPRGFIPLCEPWENR